MWICGIHKISFRRAWVLGVHGTGQVQTAMRSAPTPQLGWKANQKSDDESVLWLNECPAISSFLCPTTIVFLARLCCRLCSSLAVLLVLSLELAQAALERPISIHLTEVILLAFKAHPTRSLQFIPTSNTTTPP